MRQTHRVATIHQNHQGAERGASFMKYFRFLSRIIFPVWLLCGIWSDCLAEPSAPLGNSDKLTIDCGQVKVTIQCARASKDCTQTDLMLQRADGGRLKMKKPRGMEEYTAVGLACVKAGDGAPYIKVEYGELPVGCKFCEWFHLYSTRGEVLTHSVPPVLFIKNAPPTGHQAPNNMEYEKLYDELGLGTPHPKMNYFQHQYPDYFQHQH
ncbi:MAG: hypothetical protein FWG56_04305 [Desulfovibrionaceae bacterium]|nr:hypothetical protein [Desulfovibrionaceae bacterium]